MKYAKEVADYIGSEHTEVIITKEDVLSALEDVIGTFWERSILQRSVPA